MSKLFHYKTSREGLFLYIDAIREGKISTVMKQRELRRKQEQLLSTQQITLSPWPNEQKRLLLMHAGVMQHQRPVKLKNLLNTHRPKDSISEENLMENIDSSLRLPIMNAALSAQHNTVGHHRTWSPALINYTQVFHQMSGNRRLQMQRNRHSTTPAFIGLDRRLLSHLWQAWVLVIVASAFVDLFMDTASLWNIYCREFSSGIQRHQTVTHWKTSGKQNLRSPVWRILHLHLSTSLHFTSSLAMGEANSIGVCDSSCGGKDKTGKWHGSAPEMGTSLGRTRVSRLMTSNGGR